jgi:hypothetical protein
VAPAAGETVSQFVPDETLADAAKVTAPLLVEVTFTCCGAGTVPAGCETKVSEPGKTFSSGDALTASVTGISITL